MMSRDPQDYMCLTATLELAAAVFVEVAVSRERLLGRANHDHSAAKIEIVVMVRRVDDCCYRATSGEQYCRKCTTVQPTNSKSFIVALGGSSTLCPGAGGFARCNTTDLASRNKLGCSSFRAHSRNAVFDTNCEGGRHCSINANGASFRTNAYWNASRSR